MHSPRTIAMIPARVGSVRLRAKNLALLQNKPVISYAIESALNSRAFDRVIVNGDHELFAEVTERHPGAEFYLRPTELGSSSTKADDVVLDFGQKFNADVIAWVNPTSPLQTGSEISSVMNFFHQQGLDSLITCQNMQVHTLFEGNPVNFNYAGKFAQTQDLKPTQCLVYSVMTWKFQIFKKNMEETGCGMFCGKFGTYPVSKMASVIIKTDQDLKILAAILAGQGAGGEIHYDPVVYKYNLLPKIGIN